MVNVERRIRAKVRDAQLPLRPPENILEYVYVFIPGSYMIFPADGPQGEPTAEITAEKLGYKIHHSPGFRSLTEIHLRRIGVDGKPIYWQRSVGTLFGAYADKAHPRKAGAKQPREKKDRSLAKGFQDLLDKTP